MWGESCHINEYACHSGKTAIADGILLCLQLFLLLHGNGGRWSADEIVTPRVHPSLESRIER